MDNLEHEVDSSIRDLERRRKNKLAMAVVSLVVAAAGILAITSLMYSPDPDLDMDRNPPEVEGNGPEVID